MGPVPALADRATDCAEALLASDGPVLVASHLDADGLTSGAIASAALSRAGVAHEVTVEKQLDDDRIATFAEGDFDTVLFVDFGSGQADAIAPHVDAGAFTAVVADHHQPADAHLEHHLNPLLEGIDGASELSGAGATYLLARALAAGGPVPGGPSTGPPSPATDGGTATAPADRLPGAPLDHPDAATTADGEPLANRDLAALAVVGAVGDRQADPDGLTGANAAIVDEGEAVGVVAETTDLACYGKQTRPLPKLLAYASGVDVPGVTDDRTGAMGFLSDLDLELREDGAWRTWAHLTDAERQTVASALVRRAVRRGVPAAEVEGLVGTAYELPREQIGTALRDASEFSTVLNATARYERAGVGLAVCLGDRDGALERSRDLLATHRRNIASGIDEVTDRGVTRADAIQWVDLGDAVRDTVVGIVAGMALGSESVPADRPIVAFARTADDPGASAGGGADEGDDGGTDADGGAGGGDHDEAEASGSADDGGGDAGDGEEDETGDSGTGDAELKVSARGTGALVGRGLDLSVVMTEAATAVGGDGGGHDVAAGATIPEDERDAFVERADALVAAQLGSGDGVADAAGDGA